MTGEVDRVPGTGGAEETYETTVLSITTETIVRLKSGN